MAEKPSAFACKAGLIARATEFEIGVGCAMLPIPTAAQSRPAGRINRKKWILGLLRASDSKIEATDTGNQCLQHVKHDFG